MVDENVNSDNGPLKSNSNVSSNNISKNLASFLKNFSQNPSSANDTYVNSISELNLNIEHFEHPNIHRNKSVDEFCATKSDSFLNQLTNNDRILNIDYINEKQNKASYDIDINKSLQDAKLISCLTNTRFTSNIDVINSMQLQNLSAIKSLLDSQNGQIYLLVKSDTVQAMDSNSFTNLLEQNYSQSIQFSPPDIVGGELASSNNCSTNANLTNSTLMLAAQQLQISNNLSAAELIQKILDTPQSSNSNRNLETTINSHKIDETSISSLVQRYRNSIQSDNINNYYECSIDADSEAEITLLVHDENSVSNSQFPLTNSHNQQQQHKPEKQYQPIKQEKQILILKSSNSDMVESLPNIGRIVNESIKDHGNLFSDDNTTTLEVNNEMQNVSNNLTHPSSEVPDIVINKNHLGIKNQKKLKIKPCKTLVETTSSATIVVSSGCGGGGQLDNSSKSYSCNSPIFSIPVIQADSVLSKDYTNGDGDFKELKRKSSHNEVERRRRDRINTWISELQNMLPDNEKMALNRSKSHILKAVYDYFRIQTDQFNDIQAKYEKLNGEIREKSSIIKKLEAEKEVLLNQLQYINQAVTNTVKSTQESLNRTNVNHFHTNSNEKLKVCQPYRITNIYSNNDVNNYSNSYVMDNQNKKRKLNENDAIKNQ